MSDQFKVNQMKLNQLNEFKELTEGAARGLKDFHRSKKRIEWYQCVWRRVKAFMESSGFASYDSRVGKKFIIFEMGDHPWKERSKKHRDTIGIVNTLSEYSDNGRLRRRKIDIIKREFHGEIGLEITNFINEKKAARISLGTIGQYTLYLKMFLTYLETNGFNRISMLNDTVISLYIHYISPSGPGRKHTALAILRNFLLALYKLGKTDKDLSLTVPKDNYKSQPKLPSVYTSEEINLIITGVDRANAKGKRDCAIILLASRLGLRASDIRDLKFSNVNWVRSCISLDQQKTGKHVELPLLIEVGEAIIDYLKYGRPESGEPYIFLQSSYPFQPITTTNITSLVTNAVNNAGIASKNKRRGPHALRHSLANILLQMETPMPIISEVLGHKNSETTKLYLRIDQSSLRKCVLDVLPVSEGFYSQKGGFFYE